ncbi:MAG: hypothetical protein U5J78_02055 [Parasphingorhabdus sp.]|nr:hypothetical protein [Parasphingorhabdus sp.]
MRVPPPYVPPLLNGAQPAYAGAERLGYLAAVTIAAAAAPAAKVVQKQAPEPALLC